MKHRPTRLSESEIISNAHLFSQPTPISKSSARSRIGYNRTFVAKAEIAPTLPTLQDLTKTSLANRFFHHICEAFPIDLQKLKPNCLTSSDSKLASAAFAYTTTTDCNDSITYVDNRSPVLPQSLGLGTIFGSYHPAVD